MNMKNKTDKNYTSDKRALAEAITNFIKAGKHKSPGFYIRETNKFSGFYDEWQKHLYLRLNMVDDYYGVFEVQQGKLLLYRKTSWNWERFFIKNKNEKEKFDVD